MKPMQRILWEIYGLRISAKEGSDADCKMWITLYDNE